MSRNSLVQCDWERGFFFEFESDGHFKTEAGAMSSQERSYRLDLLHSTFSVLIC